MKVESQVETVYSLAFHTRYFSETTCGVSRTRNEDYSDFAIGWRQGMLVMAEAMSEEKPDNGWFIPNCDDLHFLLGTKNAAARRTVRVPLLQEGDEQVNAFQVGTDPIRLNAFSPPSLCLSNKELLCCPLLTIALAGNQQLADHREASPGNRSLWGAQ